MKRLFDILFSFFGLLVLLPLLMVLATWIICDSPGPIFYRQWRVGRHGVDFQIWKFRSMYTDSDRHGLITIGGNDKRITKAGYWIRRYKLDELPQLLNVLKGDMSFVGPRPEVRKYVDMYTVDQMHVLDVRPGITDAASIKYSNENDLLAQSDLPEEYYIRSIMPDKLRINLEYVHEHSLVKDIQLILLTIKKIL